jgi:hypothetical protein
MHLSTKLALLAIRLKYNNKTKIVDLFLNLLLLIQLSFFASNSFYSSNKDPLNIKKLKRFIEYNTIRYKLQA